MVASSADAQMHATCAALCRRSNPFWLWPTHDAHANFVTREKVGEGHRGIRKGKRCPWLHCAPVCSLVTSKCSFKKCRESGPWPLPNAIAIDSRMGLASERGAAFCEKQYLGILYSELCYSLSFFSLCLPPSCANWGIARARGPKLWQARSFFEYRVSSSLQSRPTMHCILRRIARGILLTQRWEGGNSDSTTWCLGPSNV
jgi:hypothetical protein